MGSLLKEYLRAPQQDSIVSNDVSETDTTEKDNNATKNSGEDVPASLEDKNDQNMEDSNEEIHGSIEKDDENNDGILRSCTNGLGNTIQENISERNNVSEEKGVADASFVRQFKKVVAIVDPPRVGLHPVVISWLLCACYTFLLQFCFSYYKDLLFMINERIKVAHCQRAFHFAHWHVRVILISHFQ